MKEQIKLAYYKTQIKKIMKKLYGTIHSKEVIERMIKDEPELIKEIILELLIEKKYFPQAEPETILLLNSNEQIKISEK